LCKRTALPFPLSPHPHHFSHPPYTCTAVIINASLVTLIGAADRRAQYASALAPSGKVRVVPRFCLYLFVGSFSAAAGAIRMHKPSSAIQAALFTLQ